MALSPDGEHFAWVGGDNRSIWVKPLGATQSRKLPETELATGLFWSPDSTAIGFFSREALKVVRLSGGTPEKVSDAPSRAARSGTWNQNGVILYGAAGNPIYRVDAAGGKPEAVTVLTPPEQTTHRRPYFLPDGNHFLFLGGNRQTGLNAIYLGALDSSETKRLVMSDFMALCGSRISAVHSRWPASGAAVRCSTAGARGRAHPRRRTVGAQPSARLCRLHGFQLGRAYLSSRGLFRGQPAPLVRPDRETARVGRRGRPLQQSISRPMGRESSWIGRTAPISG